MVEEHLRLVYHIAHRFHRKWHGKISLDDLVGYGQLGLVDASKRFDASKRAEFATFAYQRIRGAILDGIREMGYRRPKNTSDGGKSNDSHTPNSLSQPAHETSGATAFNARNGPRLQRNLGSSISFSHWHQIEQARLEGVLDDRSITPETRMISAESSATLRQAIRHLPVLERSLVEMVYFEEMTLQEAADNLGTSKSWASRLHSRALFEITRFLKDRGLENEWMK